MISALSKLKLSTSLLSLIVLPIVSGAQENKSDLVFGLLKGNSNGPWVAVSSKDVVKPGEWVKITLTTRVAGYLYAVEVLPDRVVLLSSGKKWEGQFIQAGKAVAFPELGFQLATDNNPVPPIAVLVSGTRLPEQKIREILHLPVGSPGSRSIGLPGLPTSRPRPEPERSEVELGDPIWDESKRIATVTVKPQQQQSGQRGVNQAGSLSANSSSEKLGQYEYLYVNLSPILKFLTSGGK